jgi:hypothetical protein
MIGTFYHPFLPSATPACNDWPSSATTTVKEDLIMRRSIHSFLVLVLFSISLVASAQEGFLARPKPGAAAAPKGAFSHKGVQNCRGPITRVEDAGDETWKTTPANFNVPAGGGEGGRFDKTPVLSTKITVQAGGCVDAHFSAIVGGRVYGSAPTTVFQVTLRPSGGGAPRHMVGHYETPYGQNAPAIGIGAENDVDMVSANFFQRIGSNPGDLPPGSYVVDVWWAGAGGPGGAAGAAFVLKLYLR